MPLYSGAEMDEFDRKYDDAIQALSNARSEVERLRALLDSAPDIRKEQPEEFYVQYTEWFAKK